MVNILKIIGKVFFGFVGICVIAVVFCSWYTRSNTKDYGDNRRVLNITNGNSKEALIVYQPSRGGKTDKVAENLAKGIHDAGYEVTLDNPGKHLKTDLSEYSIVVFGSPVYMGQISPVLTQYMNSVKSLTNAKILLFATGGQLNNGELDTLEQQLGSVKATEKIGFKSGKADETLAYKTGKSFAGK
ncbi:flavodoxin family protein [Clostridium manihotivorum]|uniref:Flavodoxin n=1 Tax=Clostridium manihotivorum TaxID=2320868 RepID=A0A410DSC9_9CLOT|nr:flavodoxin domain-containing protein [Clostridium manihotivorum]QAA32113.1 flavodoxin [Clostridium manihotivorum]